MESRSFGEGGPTAEGVLAVRCLGLLVERTWVLDTGWFLGGCWLFDVVIWFSSICSAIIHKYRQAVMMLETITVGTKVRADPEKCFQEIISGKLLSSLRDRPCLEVIIVSRIFRLCSSCRTNY